MIDWASAKQRLRDSELVASNALTSNPKRLSAVCRQRAAQLAARKPPAAATATNPILVFGLYPEQYGVELQCVAQVMPFADCTPVPGGPPGLLGVINLRGVIRSVIDLRQVLQLPPAENESAGHLMLWRYMDGLVGMRVDQVERVRQVAPTELLPPNEELAQPHGRFVSGMTADGLILLSVAAIFSHSIFGSTYRKGTGSQAIDGAAFGPESLVNQRPIPRESRHSALKL